MMILGFKKQFIEPILSGRKIHTIRKDPKNRWKEGNKIHFATGTRTKHYSQFKEDVCVSVQPILLFNHGGHVHIRIWTDNEKFVHNGCVDYMNGPAWDFISKGLLYRVIAENDGLDWISFKNWFVPNHGDKFEGKIIHWTNFRYESVTVDPAGYPQKYPK